MISNELLKLLKPEETVAMLATAINDSLERGDLLPVFKPVSGVNKVQFITPFHLLSHH